MYVCTRKILPLTQYIGMELCEYGDAELMMKAQPDTLLPAREAACCLFQMAFALYSGRAELSLRHFDVKLLNFFVGDGVRLLEEDRARKGEVPGEGGVTLRYGLGQEVVELRLPQERAFVVSCCWLLFYRDRGRGRVGGGWGEFLRLDVL